MVREEPRGRKPPLAVTFDTNIPALPSVRAFWATLCEMVGQPMVLTPTAAAELLRRVRLETEREWEGALKKLRGRDDTNIDWRSVSIRRTVTAAAAAARDGMRVEMNERRGIYRVAQATQDVEVREAEIYDVIPDKVFDLRTDNGIRDRKIVVEALARGFSILASNNIESIKHIRLDEWIKGSEGKRLGLVSTIMRPERAEQRLREHYDMPEAWTAHALARSCVTDPDDENLAAEEMLEAMAPFRERGLRETRSNIAELIEDGDAFDAVMEGVRKHGNSLAHAANQRIEATADRAASKRAGTSLKIRDMRLMR